MFEWLGVAFIVLFFILVFVFEKVEHTNPYENLRFIPAFYKLKRGIGQAVESGMKLHISTGYGSLLDRRAGASLASLNFLRRIAHITAVSDQPPVSTSGDALLSLLGQETVYNAFQMMGEGERYQTFSHQLSGLTPAAYVAGALPVMNDKDVSVNIITGSLGAEIGLLVDTAQRKHSLVIGGSENLSAQAVLYASVPDPLIGEELFSSGAYLNASNWHRASIRTQDIFRWILVGSLIIGAVLKSLGVL